MQRRSFSSWVIGVCAAAIAPLSMAQGKFKAGKDFRALDTRLATEVGKGQIEIIEFFWYGCPHCFAFEKTLQSWSSRLPKDVVFKRVPVRFRAEFEVHQKAFYVIESMGKAEAMQLALFEAIHVQKQTLNTPEALAAWADKNGIARAKFLELFNSFSIVGKARKATQLQEQFQVEGVPSLGVHGRFYVDGAMAGSMERALQVVDQLIVDIRKER